MAIIRNAIVAGLAGQFVKNPGRQIRRVSNFLDNFNDYVGPPPQNSYRPSTGRVNPIGVFQTERPPNMDFTPFVAIPVSTGDITFDHYMNETRQMMVEGLNRVNDTVGNSFMYLYRQIQIQNATLNNDKRKLNDLLKYTNNLQDSVDRLGRRTTSTQSQSDATAVQPQATTIKNESSILEGLGLFSLARNLLPMLTTATPIIAAMIAAYKYVPGLPDKIKQLFTAIGNSSNPIAMLWQNPTGFIRQELKNELGLDVSEKAIKEFFKDASTYDPVTGQTVLQKKFVAFVNKKGSEILDIIGKQAEARHKAIIEFEDKIMERIKGAANNIVEDIQKRANQPNKDRNKAWEEYNRKLQKDLDDANRDNEEYIKRQQEEREKDPTYRFMRDHPISGKNSYRAGFPNIFGSNIPDTNIPQESTLEVLRKLTLQSHDELEILGKKITINTNILDLNFDILKLSPSAEMAFRNLLGTTTKPEIGSAPPRQAGTIGMPTGRFTPFQETGQFNQFIGGVAPTDNILSVKPGEAGDFMGLLQPTPGLLDHHGLGIDSDMLSNQPTFQSTNRFRPRTSIGQKAAKPGTQTATPEQASKAVDDMFSILGAHEVRNRDLVKHYLKTGGVDMDPATTAWCAAAVNAALNHVGVKGTGSQAAISFAKWGQEVDPKTGFKRGDVFLFPPHGSSTGHVGMISDPNLDKQGKIGIIAGNTEDTMKNYRVFPSQASHIRRALPPDVLGNKTDVAAGVADAWRKGGMSEKGIAGVLGNIKHESNFDPGLRHPDQPKFGGEAHFAHGLYQEGGDEWNNYVKWLRKNHPEADWKDPGLQNEFSVWNLKNNYPAVWHNLNKSGTPEQAAGIYESGYLKPAVQYRGHRGPAARGFFDNMPVQQDAKQIEQPAKMMDIRPQSYVTENPFDAGIRKGQGNRLADRDAFDPKAMQLPIPSDSTYQEASGRDWMKGDTKKINRPWTDFEAQGPTPGSDGYGTKKASADLGGICAI